MGKRILVTGSREWTDAQFIEDILLLHSGGRGTVLVHGGARGADRIADRIAHGWGWDIEIHLPLWSLEGRRAGLLRNERMVNLGADVCLAFILNGSRGATHCSELAKAAGIRTLVYTERHAAMAVESRQRAAEVFGRG